MKHHFADFLDRDEDYWTVVPNRERYRCHIGDATAETKAITIFGTDRGFEFIVDLPSLEEVTLHEPGKEHLAFLSQLSEIKRLRISHVRPKDLRFLEPLVNVEQLVFEYVSGFDDLSPLRFMTKLRALHTENLRRVSDFSGLEGIDSLKFLSIYGTLDWKQPISDFEFLRGLPNLEVLSMWQVINRSPFPAVLPIVSLRHLKRLKMAWNVLSAEECALLEVGLVDVAGAAWGPYTKFERAAGDEWYEFTGKGSGSTKCTSKNAAKRCAQFEERYGQMKDEAIRLIEATQQDAPADAKSTRR